MKAVYDQSGALVGAYVDVEVTPSCLLADGTVLPLAVVGAYRIVDGYTPQPDAGQAAAIGRYIEDRLDADLDAIAQSWGYEDSNRLAGYASSTVARWQAEAQAFIAGRDAWWTKAAAIQSAWTPGSPVPTYDSVRAAMPLIARPT